MYFLDTQMYWTQRTHCIESPLLFMSMYMNEQEIVCCLLIQLDGNVCCEEHVAAHTSVVIIVAISIEKSKIMLKNNALPA